MSNGEWMEEKTPWGGTQKYKMVDGCKVYETTITTSKGTFTESAYEEYLKHAPEREAKKQAEYARMRAEARARKTCPFKGGMGRACDKEKCAFFGDSCILSNAATKPAIRDTKGLKCPINKGGYSCLPDCVLYSSGCTLGNLFTEREV